MGLGEGHGAGHCVGEGDVRGLVHVLTDDAVVVGGLLVLLVAASRRDDLDLHGLVVGHLEVPGGEVVGLERLVL